MDAKHRFQTGLIAMCVTMLVACASASRPQAPAATVSQQDVTTAARPAVLTLAQANIGFVDMDPSLAVSGEHAAYVNVYETLLRYNPPGSKEKFTPLLATSWESSEDGKTWTFNLREGVKFHDGTPFDANAVKLSIERTKKLNGPPAPLWSAVKEIKAKDDHTVVFELDYPAPLDLIASSSGGAWIISPAAVDKDAQWFQAGNDAGTGPYMIEKFEPGQRLVLTRFDDYWGGWKEGQFGKVVFETILDVNTRQQKIKAGEVDWISDIPYENLASMDALPGVKVVTGPSFQNLMGVLNTRKGPLQDVRVRQALAYSFPYETYITNALSGYATQAKGPVPFGLPGHDQGLQPYTHDLEKAKALLKEAGYENGGFELAISYGAGFDYQQRMAELWKPELAKLGITLNLKPLTWDAQWALGKSSPDKAQDIFGTMWFPGYPTPYDFLFPLFHSEEQTLFNFAYWGNPKYDELVDKANQALGVDRAAAEQMFKDAQKILLDEATAVFIADTPTVTVVREDLNGYVINPAYTYAVFAYELTRT